MSDNEQHIINPLVTSELAAAELELKAQEQEAVVELNAASEPNEVVEQQNTACIEASASATSELDTVTEPASFEVAVSNEANDDIVSEPPHTSDEIAKMHVVLEGMNEKLSSLETLFNTRIKRTDHEEKIVDQMHSELARYKEDMYAQLIRPILLDIIEIRDSITRISESYQQKPEGEQDIPNKVFAGYTLDMQDLLERNGVEVYRSSVGDSFVPIKQSAIKKVVTDEQELHGKVAVSFSSGYGYYGRTISSEKIAIYYYEEPQTSTTPEEELENG